MKSLILAAALTAAGTASAASIEWTLGPSFGGPNGHQGILTNGTLVEAIDLGGTGAAITVDPAGLNLTFTRIDSPFLSQGFLLSSGGGNSDSGWRTVLNSFEWSAGSNVTAPSFLTGLTTGNVYQVQLFTARDDGCCARTHWYGDGNGNLSTAKGDQSYLSVVGTFTADAATQTIQFFDSTANPYLNAYVLRDLTAPIPEPGTWALMLAGLAATGMLIRRRRA